MDKGRIVSQFDNRLRSSAGHDAFSANSLLDLLGWIDRGLDSMVEDGRTSQEHVDEALANLDRVMDAMRAVRLETGEPHLTELSVQTAFARLCPIFPFCR